MWRCNTELPYICADREKAEAAYHIQEFVLKGALLRTEGPKFEVEGRERIRGAASPLPLPPARRYGEPCK